jgi:hypothetical protein
MSALLKPGDWITLGAGTGLVVWLFLAIWQGSGADKVIVRAGGKVFAEAPLARNQTLNIPGPLGTSVIEIRAGRARVARDPSPRQYCVIQGWLSRAGEAAICLPNQVSIELAGAKRPYDSLNY